MNLGSFNRPATALLLLAGPGWFTFYEAYQEGLEAQQRGDHAQAVRAFTRAIAMEPKPGNQVKTYGLNFLATYHPYLRLAEACLALGDSAGATRALALSEQFGAEPATERTALQKRLQSRPGQAAPAPSVTVPPPVPASNPSTTQDVAPKTPVPLASPLSTPPLAPAAVPAVAPPGAAKPGPVPSHPAAAAPGDSRPGAAGPVPVQAPAPAPLSQPQSAPPRRRTWPWLLGALAAASIGLGLGFRRKPRAWDPPPPGSDPNLHRDFGPYHPLRTLGEGGCATAYLAVHIRSGEEAAIKVPHRHLVKDPQFRDRFRREASLGARLHHPRIVRVLTPEPAEEDLWLAMAFIQGTTLETRLKDGPLPRAEAIRIGLHIAEAIAHAHERSVVHRDLKPSNVMLTGQGALVMDFGIARVLDATRTTSTLFLGTPAYAAPEAIQNPQVGPPADRYALGLILFEMLTGRRPFEGVSAFQILEAHRTQPLPDLGLLVPDLPVPLVSLIARLCLKEPGERPEDLETLACLRALTTASWPRPAGVPPA